MNHEHSLSYQRPVLVQTAADHPDSSFHSASLRLLLGLLKAGWQDVSLFCRSCRNTGFELLAETADSMQYLTQHMLEPWQK